MAFGDGLVAAYEQRLRADREADAWLAVYHEAQADVLKIIDGEGTDAEKLAKVRAWTQE